MTSLFVSYSRRDTDYARKLTESLKCQNLDSWIDWESIPPTVDWWSEIQKGIEQADVFLFLISPASIRSKVCRREIDYAIRNGKRLIPVIVRDVNAEEAPSVLSHLNWIFIRETDDFNAAFGKLITAIETDYDWVKAHRELQVNALEWERNKHDKSYLLRGTELQLAEFQLRMNASKEPCPTDLQREYVLKSRQAADRQMRTIIGVAILVGIALIALAVFGWVQALKATEKAQDANNSAATAESNQRIAQTQEAIAKSNQQTARAGELAALAVSQREKHFDISLLLSVEAFRTNDTLQTRSVLLDSTQTDPHLAQYMQGQGQPVIKVAFSPDGKTLASGSSDGSIILWDIERDQPIGQPLTISSGPVDSLAFSPLGGRILASGFCGKEGQSGGCLEGKIILWDVSDPGTPQVVGQLSTGTTSPVRSLAFRPDGKILASASDSVILWDIEKQAAIGHPLYSEKGINRVAFSPGKGSKLLASGGYDGAIVLWDIDTQQPIGDPLTSDGGPITEIVFSPDGKTLASAASYDNDITLWDVSERETIKQLVNGDYYWVTSLAFSPDGKTIASGGKHALLNSYIYDITIWNTEEQKRTVQLVGHTGSVESMAFSPDGKTLASASGDIAVILWSLESRQPIGKFLTGQSQPSEQPSTTSVFSLDGKIRASIEDKTINLWNREKNEQIGQLSLGNQNYFTGLAFSPDGKTLASGSADGTITLWNVENQKQSGTLFTGQEGFILSIDFSPDGKTLAASRDLDAGPISSHAIILFDVQKRQPIGPPLAGHSMSTTSVDFSPDGKMLTSKSEDRTILWNLDPKFWIDVACQRSGRNFTHAEWSQYFAGTPYPAGQKDATCPQWPLESLLTATAIPY